VKLRALERQLRQWTVANRYLRAGQPERLAELGFPKAEINRLVLAGGFSALQMHNLRSTIRYYRTKSRRRLWLPDPGGTA